MKAENGAGGLIGKRLLVGVCGGIAAYKAAELVRLLKTEGAEVRVVMTRAATAFVAPLTFQALSGNPVHTDLFDADAEAAMGHIRLARWADAVVITPATADFIARLRSGLADDLLTTLCLAAEVRISLVPAMNRAMWNHPATQENVQALMQRGVRLLGPAQGAQACGEIGPGRMLEPAEIRALLANDFRTGRLKGLSVMVTAGPTREAIDPVRYISNRSSGKMGYALAAAAAEGGAAVTLITGPVSLEVPARLAEVVRVESAREMYDAVMARIAGQQIYLGAAAVADYRPISAATAKIKKKDAGTLLSLERTRDILAAVAALENAPFTVGFAAETGDVETYAKAKLKAKRLDMIAANRVGAERGGFESDENALEVYWATGRKTLAMASKTQLAKQLLVLVAERYEAKKNRA